MKYLLALVVVVALLAWLRSKRRAGSGRPGAAGAAARPAASTAAPVTPAPMLRCAVCGLHLPGSDALRLGDAAFCSEEHRRRHGGVSSDG